MFNTKLGYLIEAEFVAINFFAQCNEHYEFAVS